MDKITNETRVIDLTLGDLIEAITAQTNSSALTIKDIEEDVIGGISLAEMITGLAKQTIYGKVSTRKIPFIKIPDSKKLYFSKKDLQDWINSNKKLTHYDIANQAVDHVIKRKAFRS